MSDTAVRTGLAKVVHVSDEASPRAALEVVINRGARDGVKIGDRFLVYREGPQINDPDTGEDLGRIELVRGRGMVTHVQDHLATIRTTEYHRMKPVRRTIREVPSGALGGALRLRTYAWQAEQGIEEEVEPDTEKPFESVRVGDPVKPI